MSLLNSARGARASQGWAIPYLLAAAVLTLSAALTPRAHAGGIELTAAGAKGLGRGGAMMSSAQSTDALRYNPARLGLGPRWSVGSDTQIHFSDICFKRESAPNPGPAFPEVCNEGDPGIIPQLNGQWRIGKRFGLGLGFLPPPGTASLEFGDDKTGNFSSNGKSVPSPARYTIVKSENTAFFNTLGVGGGTDKFRMGVSLGWGVFILNNIAFSAGLPGDASAFDVRSGLAGVDLFVPRGTLAFDAEPWKGITLSSVSTVTQDVRAKGALFLSGVSAGMPYSQKVSGVEIEQPMGWETGVGARYAKSRWDLELNLVYLANSHVKDVVIDIPKDARIKGLMGTLDGKDISELQERQTIARRWQNQWLIRLGGDYDMIADRLTVRAGLSRESGGVEHGYEAVDNLNVQRTGLHVGLGAQITKRLEANFAYAAIFQPDVSVAPDDARMLQNAGAKPGNLSDDIVYLNAGKYRSGHQAVALSLIFRAAPAPAGPPPETEAERLERERWAAAEKEWKGEE